MWRTNALGRSLQTFSHPLGRFALAYKAIGSSRARGLVAGIQMTD